MSAAVSSSSNDSCSMTWHQWQAAYPTESRTGLSSVARPLERLVAPGVPVDRVVRVLEQVRACLLSEAIHAHTLPMRAGFLILACALLLSSDAHAAPPSPFVPQSIAFWDAQHGIATFGACGHVSCLGKIATTSNGGRTWLVRRDEPRLGGVYVVRGTRDAWVQTSRGLRYSPDRGSTWRTLPGHGPARRVLVSDAAHCVFPQWSRAPHPVEAQPERRRNLEARSTPMRPLAQPLRDPVLCDASARMGAVQRAAGNRGAGPGALRNAVWRPALALAPQDRSRPGRRSFRLRVSTGNEHARLRRRACCGRTGKTRIGPRTAVGTGAR